LGLRVLQHFQTKIDGETVTLTGTDSDVPMKKLKVTTENNNYITVGLMQAI